MTAPMPALFHILDVDARGDFVLKHLPDCDPEVCPYRHAVALLRFRDIKRIATRIPGRWTVNRYHPDYGPTDRRAGDEAFGIGSLVR